jgi:hypothetical protein
LCVVLELAKLDEITSWLHLSKEYKWCVIN